MGSAADSLVEELRTLERQRDRYAMAAEAATDPKVSIQHLRNVERLDEEIEAIRGALQALPAAEQETAEEGVHGSVQPVDWDDEPQTVIYEPNAETPPPAAAPNRPLAAPVVSLPESSHSPFASGGPTQPGIGADTALDSPYSASSVADMDFESVGTGLRGASAALLGIIAVGAVVIVAWLALRDSPQPNAAPPPGEDAVIIEAAPVPSDADQR